MSSLVEQLSDLREEALEALAASQSTESTRAWHSQYLGRKGALTGLLSGMGQLPREERPIVGKTANEIKLVLEAALEERQAAIAHEEMMSQLSSEQVDVTLPGRKPIVGAYHPTTVALARDCGHPATHGLSGI